MKFDRVNVAKTIFSQLDVFYFVKHSPDWSYIAVSSDNYSMLFGFETPRNSAEYDALVDGILVDMLSIDIRSSPPRMLNV